VLPLLPPFVEPLVGELVVVPLLELVCVPASAS
jgi:hypothetical protein